MPTDAPATAAQTSTTIDLWRKSWQKAKKCKAKNRKTSNGWLGDFVRITIMLWAMAIITANYIGYFKGQIVTFSASLLPWIDQNEPKKKMKALTLKEKHRNTK